VSSPLFLKGGYARASLRKIGLFLPFSKSSFGFILLVDVAADDLGNHILFGLTQEVN
jgi:hypothetical protein